MAARKRRDDLPEILGDERDDRMRQTQRRLEHAQQRTPGRALLRVGPGLHLNLGDFDIPIAVLVPHELVDRAGGIVETVLGEALFHLRFGLLQQAHDPAVRLRKLQVSAGTAFFGGMVPEPAILAFAVHQHEATGIPQLVAEVAVAFATVQVEVERARERRQRSEGEAHGVGAVAPNALRVVLADRLLDLLLVFRAQQADRGFRNQVFKRDAVDQVQRIDGIALRLRHFLAFGVAHNGVDVDVAERHFAGEVQGHHDHPCDPEEDDVESGDQHR